MNILTINLLLSTLVFWIAARIYLLPRLHALEPEPDVAGEGLLRLLVPAWAARQLSGLKRGIAGGHAFSIPGTCSIVPAVIAWTTSSCVVLAVS